MRLHIGKAFNSLKLTDYLQEEDIIQLRNKTELDSIAFSYLPIAPVGDSCRNSVDKSFVF